MVLSHEWPTQMYHDTIWGHETLKLDAMATFPAIVKLTLELEWACNFSDCSINEREYVVDAMAMLITTRYRMSIVPQLLSMEPFFIPVENFLAAMVDLPHHLVDDSWHNRPAAPELFSDALQRIRARQFEQQDAKRLNSGDTRTIIDGDVSRKA